MGPSEWWDATDPEPMLQFLRKTASERKLRLFAVACCRRVWRMLANTDCRRAVQLTERVADDPTLRSQLFHASAEVFEARNRDRHKWESPHALASFNVAIRAAEPDFNMALAIELVGDVQTLAGGDTVGAALAALLRDIFRHPIYSVAVDPRWLTRNVVELARTIYEERAFDRMPILADALMDARCIGEEILNHCRQSTGHVRGCWLIDLLLGKG